MDYRFVNTGWDEAKLKLYSDLLSLVFTGTKKYTPEYLNWQYSLNPAGKVVGCDAFFKHELAGHYVTIPVQYKLNDEPVRGLLSLNTVTHPKHQGKGLFTKLAEKTYNEGTDKGYKFVIGVANQNSTHGFVNKLGFTLIAPLSVGIFFRSPQLMNVPEELMQSSWNMETVQWRLENPSADYYKNNLSVTSRTHIPFINAVLSNRKEVFLSEFHEKKSPLKMSIGLNNCKSSLGLPAFLKPAPLNLIFRPLGDFKIDINSANLFFELIDFDAY